MVKRLMCRVKFLSKKRGRENKKRTLEWNTKLSQSFDYRKKNAFAFWSNK